MATQTSTARPKALPNLILPTVAARRTACKPLAKNPKGLDVWMTGLQGRWQRRSERLRQLLEDAATVDGMADKWGTLTDARLRQASENLRDSIHQGGRACGREVELSALGVVREMAERELGMRPFVVQLAGALALRRGMLAEMATGEGKTLTAVLAAVLAGWSGRPCHVITVNDYLASRDAERMKALYRAGGLRVGVVTSTMEGKDRRAGYHADVTYTTSKEVVADFLRDRLLLGKMVDPVRRHLRGLLEGTGAADGRMVMNGLHTAIVDEADSVLIDEAVTPLIISRSSPNPEMEAACGLASSWAEAFTKGEDYRIDAGAKSVEFLPAGEARLAMGVEGLAGFWRGPKRRAELVRQALAAREFFHRDQQYVVLDDKVVIVDEFTGRMMPGRTWREGLHQAVEAREGLPVSSPSETLARISFQRYFRFYQKLSGMTGTGFEARDEFWQTYGLPVVRIPTHRPCIRVVHPDRVFAKAETKWTAVAEKVVSLARSGIPVLVGTRHISSSEELARRLDAEGVGYNLLHAIHHRDEARIVAEAGKVGKVTIATNMAGRGTDILLGSGVAAAGGLRVIATERHESGRIDRQLFGRCARQGDPGEVHVYLSMEDELIRRHVAAPVRVAIAGALRRDRPEGRQAALTAVRFAQWTAQKQAWKQRRHVLRTDDWIDEALSFVGKSD